MSILSPVASVVRLSCVFQQRPRVLNSGDLLQLRAAYVSVNLFSLLCNGRDPVTTSSLGDISRYGGPIAYLFVYGFILFGILVWVDSGSFLPRRIATFRSRHSRGSSAPGDGTLREDVKIESEAVMTSSDSLRVLRIVKSFDGAKDRVLDDVSFGVGKDTVFALLGPNGAGKTTSFNVIREYCSLSFLDVAEHERCLGGEVIPDGGDVFINGTSVIHHPKSARLSLGVCPQFTAIDSQLTVREHLMVYGRLKGLYRGDELHRNVEDLMRATSLYVYADRLASKLSGGNQRKLSLAIALIGEFPDIWSFVLI